MNKAKVKSPKKVCAQCGEQSVRDVRRTRVYKGIVIENIPATFCSNCGEELYDLATMRLIERIVAEPDVYTSMVTRPVARVA